MAVMARWGLLRFVPVWHGSCGKSSPVGLGLGVARQFRSVEAWCVSVGSGRVWQGSFGTLGCVLSRWCVFWYGSYGKLRLGVFRWVEVRSGKAVTVREIKRKEKKNIGNGLQAEKAVFMARSYNKGIC